jgi:peptidoglycan L-alanyl-D-glutamate endopeptidase CwlK
MPSFSRASRERLDTCDDRIIDICEEAIKFIDFTVVCGHRTVDEQNELYAQGRTRPGRIITYKRGGDSVHNTWPTRALDFAPYPIDWSDIVRFGEVAGIMKYIAWQKHFKLQWGGDWPNFRDYPHIQVGVVNG